MTNYASAASRHWSDAEILRENDRIDNADHLYGIAAECAIKTTIVLEHGINDDNLPKKYWEHVDLLWDLVPIQRISRNYPGIVPIIRLKNPFCDWNVRNRYAATGTVTLDVMMSHRLIVQRLLSATQVLGVRREKK